MTRVEGKGEKKEEERGKIRTKRGRYDRLSSPKKQQPRERQRQKWLKFRLNSAKLRRDRLNLHSGGCHGNTAPT